MGPSDWVWMWSVTLTLFIQLKGIILEQAFVCEWCHFNLDLLHVNRSTIAKSHKAKLALIVLKCTALMTKTITTVQLAVIHVFTMLCYQRSHFAFNAIAAISYCSASSALESHQLVSFSLGTVRQLLWRPQIIRSAPRSAHCLHWIVCSVAVPIGYQIGTCCMAQIQQAAKIF